jgi:hypothetical protein
MKGALAFWLRVVESRGGLAEPSGDTALVMLPQHLQERFDLPAELEVTDDPDVARDDGVMFLGVGHPVIARAADALLAEADAGVVELAPGGRTPELATLEEKARQRFPVVHGRVDITETPRPGTIGVVRLGALIRYTLSDEDHYQEHLEQWVDAATRLPLADAIGARLLSAQRQTAASGHDLDRRDVAEAVLAAYREIDAAAERRRVDLAKDLAGGCREEQARAEAYYAAALESIAKRRASAATDRQALLDARAESTRAERARRLEEIAEKYRGTYETQPFRLHLLRMPALQLPAQVRRGDRRYPLVLTWVPAAADFLPVRCPSCARHAPLDAGKTKLGCISCHTKVEAIPPQRPPANSPLPDGGQAPAKPATGSRAESPPAKGGAAPTRARSTIDSKRVAAAVQQRTTVGRRTAASARPARVKELTGRQLTDAGAKLAMALWRAHAEDDSRGMKRLAAQDSPMAAAHRLFRSQAPAVTVGIPPDMVPQELTTQTYPHRLAGHYVTAGELIAGAASYAYAVVWRDDAGQRRIVEVLPQGYLGVPAATPYPEPVELDPVASVIWRTCVPRLGLVTTIRALTAWWRLPDAATIESRLGPSAIGAAVERAVCYWGGGGPGGYDQAAQAYDAPVDAVRKAGALLQKALRFSADKPW